MEMCIHSRDDAVTEARKLTKRKSQKIHKQWITEEIIKLIEVRR